MYSEMVGWVVPIPYSYQPLFLLKNRCCVTALCVPRATHHQPHISKSHHHLWALVFSLWFPLPNLAAYGHFTPVKWALGLWKCTYWHFQHFESDWTIPWCLWASCCAVSSDHSEHCLASSWLATIPASPASYIYPLSARKTLSIHPW